MATGNITNSSWKRMFQAIYRETLAAACIGIPICLGLWIVVWIWTRNFHIGLGS
jgi:Mg/Co/Ni transporter MgtE